MRKNVNRIMIAAPKSGSGKTLITCGLLQGLLNVGKKVAAFKAGPDYIDPMFHREVIGVESNNLDTFFLDEDGIKESFIRNTSDSEIGIIEGVMGLFDGMSLDSDKGSSYELAKWLDIPIILVIDAKGMARTILALIAGLKAFDEAGLIKGVILNKCSVGYYERLKEEIESTLDIKCLGYVPVMTDCVIDSRHLGLMLPTEVSNLKDRTRKLAECLTKTVDIKELISIAEGANAIEVQDSIIDSTFFGIEKMYSNLKIAISRDEAFCFIYKDNIKALEAAGAEIVYFSPVHDKALPDDINGVILYGGYPENYGKQLQDNISMRESIRNAITNGLPCIAECGGFMYLFDGITDIDGHYYEMCGVLKGKCENIGHLVRFGYVDIKDKTGEFIKNEIIKDGITKDGIIKGHEFHYYDSDNNGEDCIATKPVTGKSWDCVHVKENSFMGFPHLYYPSNIEFVYSFLEKASEYCSKNGNNDNAILESDLIQSEIYNNDDINENTCNVNISNIQKNGMDRETLLIDEKNKYINTYKYYENRACKYYPCHSDIDHINCMFCYCPMYSLKNCPGKPEYKTKEDGRVIKVCTNCDYPHRAENYENIMRVLKS